ncbi:MAG: proliferating cell nuclear antigen (pcna) [archaeon]
MKAKLENPALLSKAVELISELVTEVRIKANEFGMSITAIDPANVAMVSFKIPKSIFSQFEADNEILGVNLDNLKKILKRCGIASNLILEREENMLKIQIEDRIKRNFTLNLIDIEGEEKNLPNLDYSARVELNSLDMTASIEDCAVVADACSFIIKDGKFIIEAKGINSARSEFSTDEAKIDAEECKARYSLEYLQKFSKASKLSEKTILHFANDHPLRIDIRTANMEFNFILAPRVETED